jgi:hypothetical protein
MRYDACLACALFLAQSGCTINFELTSQRTALENQVMGSYKELDDDLVLVSTVRGPANGAAAAPSARQRRAIDARQNQEFNRDDVDELKTAEILGETNQGTIVVVPKKYGKAAGAVKDKLSLAEALVDEENADRLTIWKRIIETNPNLSAKDLPAVQRTYAKMQRDLSLPGQWFQDESGAWQRKSGDLVKDVEP